MFGFRGKVLTDFGLNETAYALAIQADGKIVAAGYSDASGSVDFALARYKTRKAGSLDGTFGTGGKVFTDFSGSGSGDFAFALAVQSDGKIVAAGNSNASGTSDDFALARYNTDGTLDGTFGTAGRVLTDFSGSGISPDFALALALQSDGKVVAAGISSANGSDDYALARYNVDGSLDGSFGVGGKVLTDFSGTGSTDDLYGLSIQEDGKIVAAGFSAGAGSDPDFALALYNSVGSLDGTFGTNGKVLTDFSGTGSNDYARAVVVQNDGKIVAAGYSDASGSFDFALARYNPDGTLDGSFDIDGLSLTDFDGSAGYDLAFTLAIQTDAKVLEAGTSLASGSLDFALARFNADGSLDASFGTGGKVLTEFSGTGSGDEALALVLQSDGKIVVAGYSDASGSADFALARYLG
jgi:uncharacterized delta-60 repeat protein